MKSTGVWLVDGHVLQSLRPYGGFPRWRHGETMYLPMQELQKIRVLSLGGKDPLEEEMANVLQYSCWDNPMNRGAWGATDHGVTESTRLSTHTRPCGTGIMSRTSQNFCWPEAASHKGRGQGCYQRTYSGKTCRIPGPH